MSITDELREWMDRTTIRFDDRRYLLGTDEELTAIADRIDAEHEAKVSYWQGASYKDGYDEGFAGADDWLGQHEDAMAEHGWVRLPVDADGVPIRIGDAMVLQHEAKEKPYVVQSLTWDGEDWYFTCDEGFFNACGWEHYHEQTVEDVLRDMHAELDEVTALYVGEAIDSDERDRDEARIFAEYAAKLRLAGDAE